MIVVINDLDEHGLSLADTLIILIQMQNVVISIDSDTDIGTGSQVSLGIDKSQSYILVCGNSHGLADNVFA